MRYVDPEAQKRIDELEAKLERIDALSLAWLADAKHPYRGSSARGMLRRCYLDVQDVLKS